MLTRYTTPIVIGLSIVAAVSLTSGLGLLAADPAVWLNGAAAIITAIACLVEARSTSRTVAELERRLSVIEALINVSVASGDGDHPRG